MFKAFIFSVRLSLGITVGFQGLWQARECHLDMLKLPYRHRFLKHLYVFAHVYVYCLWMTLCGMVSKCLSSGSWQVACSWAWGCLPYSKWLLNSQHVRTVWPFRTKPPVQSISICPSLACKVHWLQASAQRPLPTHTLFWKGIRERSRFLFQQYGSNVMWTAYTVQTD